MIPGIVAGGASTAFAEAPETDPHFANVVSLLHFDGANESTTFTDETGRIWSAEGSAQISTDQSVFGGASGLFDGSGDYLSTSDAEGLTLGASDFTIEGSLRFNGSVPASTCLLASHYEQSGNQRGWQFGYLNGGSLRFLYSTTGSSNIDLTTAWAPSPDVWYEIAASRVGSSLYLLIDGVLVSTQAISGTIFDSSAALLIGGRNPASGVSGGLPGWFDEFRLTIGVGRYTASYTPRIAPFPDS